MVDSQHLGPRTMHSGFLDTTYCPPVILNAFQPPILPSCPSNNPLEEARSTASSVGGGCGLRALESQAKAWGLTP